MTFATLKDLLRPPVRRAAYSDRTAWLMAEMSRLAYLRFEGSQSRIDDVVETLAGLTDTDQIREALGRYEELQEDARSHDRRELEEGLQALGFDLVETFNTSDTQAFLARRDEPDPMAILSFRGTEKDFGDIKTDLDVRFFSRGGVKIHNGFLQAFEVVEESVRQALASLDGYALYLTGHSLGGALALVATRALNGDEIAACYTYGSPKVGNQEFSDAIKPPIYRVVNAADMVPRVPPTWLIELGILIAKALPIPWLRASLVTVLGRYRGYRQVGDMRYLTACRDDCSDLRMIPNLNILDRGFRLVRRLIASPKSGATDHFIRAYCTKLRAYAETRLSKP